MERPKHRAQMNLLIEPLERHFAGRRDVYIGGNMALYYSELQARNNDFRAPDFFVVLDAIEDRERLSWVVWQENGRTPDVVIELLSPSTEREDRGRKMQVYAGLRVSEYFLHDPNTGALEGYRLEHGAYAPMTLRPDGDFDCKMLGLRLGMAFADHGGLPGSWLRWKLPDGTPLPTGLEEAERERAAAHEARARAEEERARAEEERARAEEERARAEEERARAEEERARADTAEARAHRLAERLRSLGIDPES